MIDGVLLKSLDTHQDERGFFREIIRETDDFFQEGFGPWSHSLMYPGVIKAWHIHKKQTDWWYVSTGVLKIVLYDKRPESATYRQNMERMPGDGYDPSILKTPPPRVWLMGASALQAQPIFSTSLLILTIRRTKVVFPTMIRKSGMTGSRDLRLCRSNFQAGRVENRFPC